MANRVLGTASYSPNPMSANGPQVSRDIDIFPSGEQLSFRDKYCDNNNKPLKRNFETDFNANCPGISVHPRPRVPKTSMPDIIPPPPIQKGFNVRNMPTARHVYTAHEGDDEQKTLASIFPVVLQL